MRMRAGFGLVLCLLMGAVAFGGDTEGDGSYAGSDYCDNPTYTEDDCGGPCDKEEDGEADSEAGSSAEEPEGSGCEGETGEGGKVIIGWGEYFHTVVDYRRDPTRGAGCTGRGRGVPRGWVLPGLEVVRYFGSRHRYDVGFSGGWLHNYGHILGVVLDHDTPGAAANGDTILRLSIPGMRVSGDIAFLDRDRQNAWEVGGKSDYYMNVGRYALEVSGGVWEALEDRLTLYTGGPFPDSDADVVAEWKNADGEEKWILLRHPRDRFLEARTYQEAYEEAMSSTGRRILKEYFLGNLTNTGERGFAVYRDSDSSLRGYEGEEGVIYPIGRDETPVAWTGRPEVVKVFNARAIGTGFSITDYREDRVWKFEMKEEGGSVARLVWMGDRWGNGVSLRYEVGLGRWGALLKEARDDFGHKITYHWYEHPWGYRFIHKVTLPDGSEIHYEYREGAKYTTGEVDDDEYRFVDDEGERGGVYFKDDDWGILRRVVYPDGSESWYARNRDEHALYLIFSDAAGRPGSRKDRVWIDERMGRAYMTRDPSGRLKFYREDDEEGRYARILRSPRGEKKEFVWEMRGDGYRTTELNDRNGERIYAYGFDGLGRQVSREDAAGNIWEYTYFDDRYHLVGSFRYNGVLQYTAAYNEEGRRVAKKYPDGTLLWQEYTNGKLRKSSFYAAEDVLGHEPLPGARPVRYIEKTYNARGQLRSHRDAEGNVTEYVYETGGYGNLLAIIHPDDDDDSGNNPVTKFTYNARGLKASVRDPEGRITSFEYDVMGRLTRTVYADGTEERIAYGRSNPGDIRDWAGTAGLAVRRTDRNGMVTAFGYDMDDRRILKEMYDPADPEERSITEYEYAADSTNLIRRTQDGDTTRYEYFDGKRTATRIHADKDTMLTERRGYDAQGRLAAIVDAYGRRTAYARDGHGRIVRESREVTPGGEAAVTRRRYSDWGGFLLSETDPLGRETRYEYDMLGRREVVIHPDGDPANDPIVTYTYDLVNRLTSISDETGAVTTFIFDARGNRTEVIHPDGACVKYTYTLDDRVAAIEDERGHVTKNSWGICCGRLEAIEDALGNSTRFVYDGNGNMTGREDALGAREHFMYDFRNRPVAYRDKMGRVYLTTYGDDGSVYDSRLEPGQGRYVITQDPLGGKEIQVYDGSDRLIRTIDALGRSSGYAYGEEGGYEKVTYQDAEGKRSHRYTDGLGNVVKTVDALGKAAVNRHDLAGNRIEEVDARGTIRKFVYDARNRKVEEIDDFAAGGIRTTFRYNGRGELTRLVDGKGNATAYTYNARGFLVEERFADGGAVRYSYDAAGNLTEEVDARGNVIRAGFDELNRLRERAIRRAPGVGGTTLQTFGYDALSRMTSATDNNEPGVRDDDVVETWEYDALGRVTRESQNGLAVESEYNAMHRTGQIYPGGDVVGFSHDAAEDLSGGARASRV